MKIGDKLYCIKNIYAEGTNFLNYTKNKYYNIVYIDPYGYDVALKCNNNYPCGFSLKKNNTNNEWYIWDYFYTIKQLRKIKLDKLKENKYE